jgi:hypothetical protein
MTERRTEQLKKQVLDARNTVCTERARFYTEVSTYSQMSHICA